METIEIESIIRIIQIKNDDFEIEAAEEWLKEDIEINNINYLQAEAIDDYIAEKAALEVTEDYDNREVISYLDGHFALVR